MWVFLSPPPLLGETLFGASFLLETDGQMPNQKPCLTLLVKMLCLLLRWRSSRATVANFGGGRLQKKGQGKTLSDQEFSSCLGGVHHLPASWLTSYNWGGGHYHGGDQAQISKSFAVF